MVRVRSCKAASRAGLGPDGLAVSGATCSVVKEVLVHAKDTIRIDAPVEDVDRLALPPDAWSRYFVGMSEPEKIEGDGGPGTTAARTAASTGAGSTRAATPAGRRGTSFR
jgi:hypothetical protein